MVIYEGEVNYKALKKSKMDINDMMAKAREKGYFDLNQIQYAVFENSGGLSLMPKSQHKPVVAEDINAHPKPPELPYYLVDDGHVIYSTLRTLGRDTSWLYEKLGVKGKKDLKQIILAIYDKETDTINVSKKWVLIAA